MDKKKLEPKYRVGYSSFSNIFYVINVETKEVPSIWETKREATKACNDLNRAFERFSMNHERKLYWSK